MGLEVSLLAVYAGPADSDIDSCNTPLTASVHTTDTTECNGMRPETCSPTQPHLMRNSADSRWLVHTLAVRVASR